MSSSPSLRRAQGSLPARPRRARPRGTLSGTGRELARCSAAHVSALTTAIRSLPCWKAGCHRKQQSETSGNTHDSQTL